MTPSEAMRVEVASASRELGQFRDAAAERTAQIATFEREAVAVAIDARRALRPRFERSTTYAMFDSAGRRNPAPGDDPVTQPVVSYPPTLAALRSGNPRARGEAEDTSLAKRLLGRLWHG